MFSHVSSAPGGTAIGVDDPGFQSLLRSTGALLTWKSGERYVLITTSVPTVVSFALGDRRYDVGPIALTASFAPYERGNEAYLPLNEVLHALDLAPRQDGAVTVLQPQLASLDVRQESNRVTLLARGGAPLHPRIVEQNVSAVTYAFDGVGTTLSGIASNWSRRRQHRADRKHRDRAQSNDARDDRPPTRHDRRSAAKQWGP